MNYKPGVTLEKSQTKSQAWKEKIFLLLSILSSLSMLVVLIMIFKNSFFLAFIFSVISLLIHASKMFFNSLEKYKTSWVVYLIISVALVIVLSFHTLF